MDWLAIVLEPAVEGNAELIGDIRGCCMDREAMKDEHVARVDGASGPVVRGDRVLGDLGDMKILILVLPVTETVGALKDPQWAHVKRAVVQWNPDGEALGIAAHEAIVLMGMNGKAVAIGKDQATDWLWVNQGAISDDHPHHPAQG